MWNVVFLLCNSILWACLAPSSAFIPFRFIVCVALGNIVRLAAAQRSHRLPMSSSNPSVREGSPAEEVLLMSGLRPHSEMCLLLDFLTYLDMCQTLCGWSLLLLPQLPREGFHVWDNQKKNCWPVPRGAVRSESLDNVFRTDFQQMAGEIKSWLAL